MQPIERVIIALQPNKSESESEVHLQETTPGISSTDLGEIMDWANALLLPEVNQLDPLNLFYFLLPSGYAAIGRLLPRFLSDNNAKTVQSFFLHFMVVSPDTLLAFGNNPILVFQTALNAGQLAYSSSPQKELAPMELCLAPLITGPQSEHASWVDIPLLQGLAINPGEKALALLIQSVLDSIATYFTSNVSPLHLISGLFCLLPVHWRTELCFSVGLQFGGEHYLRLTANHSHYKNFVPPDPNLPIFKIDQITRGEQNYELFEGWALFVELVLQKDCFDFFQEKIISDYRQREQDGCNSFDDILKTEEINESGFEWLYELQYLLTLSPISQKDFKERALDLPLLETEVPYPNHLRVELEYEQPLVVFGGKNVLFSPYQRLFAQFPERKAELQQLDALIAHALKNSTDAMEILGKYWKEFRSRSADDDLWTVREEYIHYIQQILTYEKRQDNENTLKKNFAALEILELLLY